MRAARKPLIVRAKGQRSFDDYQLACTKVLSGYDFLAWSISQGLIDEEVVAQTWGASIVMCFDVTEKDIQNTADWFRLRELVQRMREHPIVKKVLAADNAAPH